MEQPSILHRDIPRVRDHRDNGTAPQFTETALMADAPVQVDRTLKRYWGRLLWVWLTNLTVFAFAIYVLVGVFREDVRNSLGNPPPPSLWDAAYDNPSYALAVVLSGIGLLLETLKRREAGFFNCFFWLMLSICAIALSWPIPSKVAVFGICVVMFMLYVVPAEGRFVHKQR